MVSKVMLVSFFGRVKHTVSADQCRLYSSWRNDGLL